MRARIPTTIHWARLEIESGKLIMLTESDGTHDDLRVLARIGIITWRRWSRVDHPPVHELRRIEGRQRS